MRENANTNLRGKIIRYALVLMGVCLASGLGVSLLFVSARDRIRDNEVKAFQQKLADVLGEDGDATPVGKYPEGTGAMDMIYVVEAGMAARYAATGSEQGYQSVITVLVSVDAPAARTPVGDDPRLYRLAVVSSGETPGLGENVNQVEADVSLWGALAGQGGGPGEKKRPAFQEQFSGKRLSDLVVDKQAGTDKIYPVTGATITSTAVTGAARNAVERIIEKTRELYGP